MPMASIKPKIIGLVRLGGRIQFFLQGTYNALVGKASRPLINARLDRAEWAQALASTTSEGSSSIHNGPFVSVFNVLFDHLVRPV